MSIESRRATVQKLILTEAVAGHLIAEDADFLSLAERWIQSEIDMAEFRRLYQEVRAERRRRKWNPQPSTEVERLPTEEPQQPDENRGRYQ